MTKRNFKIAEGHNKRRWAVPFSELNPPLFEEYSYDRVPYEWIDPVKKIGGDLIQYSVGHPSVVFTFPFLTIDEYAYLQNFGANVTVCVQNRSENRWDYYNGIIHRPEGTRFENGYFVGYELRVVNLKLIDDSLAPGQEIVSHPPAPVLVHPPVNGIIYGNDPGFSWVSIPNTTSYQIQISSSINMGNVVQSATTSTNEYVALPLADGEYWWRVRVADNGLWSEVRRFVIDSEGQPE